MSRKFHAANGPHLVSSDQDRRAEIAEQSLDSAAFLAGVPLFSTLDLDDRRRIAAIAETRRFARGRTIFDEGDSGDRMFVIVAGSVDVTRRAEDGEIVTLASLGPRQYFGEMALFDEVARSATVVVREMATVLALRRADFLELIRSRAEIALRMIADQNRRLRDVDARVVAIDCAARRNAPTFVERIVTEFPHPIALVFQETDAACDPGTRLRRLVELVEVILQYTMALTTSLYLAEGPHEPSSDLEVLAGQRPPTLGRMNFVIRALLTSMSKTDKGALGQALCGWLEPSRPHRGTNQRIVDNFIAMRNDLKHGSEAALDEARAESFLAEFQPKMKALLMSLDFLCNYPLVYVQSMGFSDGSFHYTYQHCMGAFRTFHTETFTSEKPVDTHRLYALDREANRLLPLYPWVGLYRCEACGDKDIFFSQGWSPSAIHCVEFGRGHRHVVRDVSPSVGRMLETLERRVAQAEAGGVR